MIDDEAHEMIDDEGRVTGIFESGRMALARRLDFVAEFLERRASSSSAPPPPPPDSDPTPAAA